MSSVISSAKSRLPGMKGGVEGDPLDVFGGNAAKQSTEMQERISTEQLALQRQALADQLALQRDYFEYGKDQQEPYSAAGRQALPAQLALAGLGSPELQAQIMQGLQASPEFLQAQQLGEDAIMRNAAMTGGLRSGGAQQALAQGNQQLLTNMMNRQYDRLSGITGLGQNTGTNLGQQAANYSAQGSQAYQNFAGQSQAALESLGAGVQGAMDRKSAATSNALGTGVGVMSLFAEYASTAKGGAAFSDARLKKNAKILFTIGNVNFYAWEWNDKAKSIGANGLNFGVMAQEIKGLYPNLVGSASGFLTVDYNSLLKVIKNALRSI